MEQTLETTLAGVDVFQGLEPARLRRVASLGKGRALAQGEYLFLLGDSADRLYVVLDGKIELCFPLTLGKAVRDISIESVDAGKTLGWSALVKPHRLTLSARASEATTVLGFPRSELLRFFEEDPEAGYLVFTRLSELIGIRLLTVQALWARRLQKELEGQSNA